MRRLLLTIMATTAAAIAMTCRPSDPFLPEDKPTAAIVSAAPTVTLVAAPPAVDSGGTATLTWSAQNATSCNASGGWTGSRPLSGTAVTPALVTTTGYTLTCMRWRGWGWWGSWIRTSRTVTVTVTVADSTPLPPPPPPPQPPPPPPPPPPSPPSVVLTATPTTVAASVASTLTWSSADATSCTASGGWTGTKTTSGTESTGPLTASTAFTLACEGPGGSGTRTVTVTVATAPTITLTASPPSVVTGAPALLTWSTTNAASCTASGAWSGAQGLSGSQSTGPLTATSTFTLGCTGPGGSSSSSTIVTVTPAPISTFPLHTEAGKRYLVDAQGHPFLVHGDAPWSLMVQLTRAEVDQYLEDRRLKGFNTVLVEIIEHYFSAQPPRNVYGDGPFLTPGDFSTPNEAYFAHVEYVLTKARENGFLVLLTPSYMGYNGGAEGWYAEMVQNGATKLRAYGQYLATRFRNFDNILWVHGGDFEPTDRTLARAVANGIRDVETKWPHTFHGYHHAALEVMGTGEAWLSVNNVYANANSVVAQSYAEYNRSTMPFFLIEAVYENEGVDARGVRRQAYQAVLSGAAGQVMGNRPVWLFDAGWQSALNSNGARTLAHLRSLLDAWAWWTLVPDAAHTLLTVGVGAGQDVAPAARAADGSLALIYTPTARNLTVDLSRLAGPNVVAHWYDPAAGTYRTVSGSPFAATGSRTFATPGSNGLGDADWVLVLTSSP